jgi:predicted alpha/beta hydrolase family esterase
LFAIVKAMTKYLILHGTGATPRDNWFMWLKGRLIGQGHDVWLPQLPNADKPDAKTYTDFLLSNKNFKIDSDTIVIGHSSGAVAALLLIQGLSEDTKMKGALLVGSFKDDLGREDLKGLFTDPLNFDAMKSHCSNFLFLHSDDDPHCPLDHAKFLASKTSGELMVAEGQGHFDTDNGPQYKQFPELLNFIAEMG